MKDFIIRKIKEESNTTKLLRVLEVLGFKNEYLKISTCNHRWKYFCGTPQNETHKCIKCGLIA